MRGELDLMMAFFVLKDYGINKIHGELKKEGSQWASEDRVQGDSFGNLHHLQNSNTDPLLRDTMDPKIADGIMQMIGVKLIQGLKKEHPDIHVTRCLYAVDVDSTTYFLNSSAEDVLIAGDAFSIIGNIRDETTKEFSEKNNYGKTND